MARVDFADWRPDVATYPQPLASQFLARAENVMPLVDGYGPVPGIASSTDALGAAPRGGAAFLNKSGETTVIIGDATGLNELVSDGSWTDVTRSAGAYSLPDEENWSFTQFGDLVVAVQIGNNPQALDMTGGVRFADLAGSPPRARYAVTLRSQLLLCNTSNSESEIWSSALNDIEGWTVGTSQSWKQTLADGGPIRGAYSTDSAIIMQQDAIRRVDYVGDQYVVDIQVMERGRGLDLARSLAPWGAAAFYVASDGIKLFDGRATQDIGAGRFDKWFLDDIARSSASLVTAAIDPENKLYCLAYPSTASSSGCDSILVYNWTNNKAALWRQPVAQLIQALSLPTTWDGFDDIFATVDDITPSPDNSYWAGGARKLGVLSTDQKYATFSSETMLAGLLETGDLQVSESGDARVQLVEPLIDVATASDLSVQVGTRRRIGGTIAYGANRIVGNLGRVRPNTLVKLARIVTAVESGAAWTKARGLELEWVSMGRR